MWESQRGAKRSRATSTFPQPVPSWADSSPAIAVTSVSFSRVARVRVTNPLMTP